MDVKKVTAAEGPLKKMVAREFVELCRGCHRRRQHDLGQRIRLWRGNPPIGSSAGHVHLYPCTGHPGEFHPVPGGLAYPRARYANALRLAQFVPKGIPVGKTDGKGSR